VVLLLWAVAGLMLWSFRDAARMSFDMSLLRPAHSKAMGTLERLERYFPAWGQSTVYLVSREKKPVDASLLGEKLKQLGDKVGDVVLPSHLLPSQDDFAQNSAWFSSHADWLDEARRALDAEGFTAQAAALPAGLVEAASRWNGSLPEALQEVGSHPLMKQRLLRTDTGLMAAGSLSLSGLLSEQVHAELRGLDAAGVRCAAWPMVSHDVEPMLAHDMKTTLVPMFLVLLLSVFTAMRSWREALLVIGLLLLGLALVLGWALWKNPDGLHFLNVLSLVLLIGAGLDYFLHMVFSLRRDEGDVAAVLSSTGMAIVFCALSTAIGFGSLALANNKAMADLGLVSAVGVIVMLLLALLVLPGLWKRLCQSPPGQA
jgi:predicted exporter